MDNSEIRYYREHFKSYTDSFFGSDEYQNRNYKIKQEHTKRVSKNILEICSSIKFTEYEKNIAETIALYHDIGRFIQFQKYRTFSDSKSENHALLGINVLKNEKIIDKSKFKRSILSAISVHNLKNIPGNLKDKDLLYSKLIRDADKLDIFHVLTNYYKNNKKNNPALDLDLIENTEYSQKVLDDFFANKCIDTTNLKGTLDFKLLQLSWIYDINFEHTLHIIKNNNYIEKIVSILPENPQKGQIYSHIKKTLIKNRFIK